MFCDAGAGIDPDVYKAVQLIKETADIEHAKAKHNFWLCHNIE